MYIGFGYSPSKAERNVGVAIDADASAFFTAASITDSTQKSAVNQLVLDLKSYNIWTKMKVIYPIVGGSASSHAVNLKTPGTYNLTFSTGWTHSSTGMTPNGSSAYADTSFIPNGNLTLNNAHLSVYNRTSSFGTSGGKIWIGASSNGGVYSNKQQFYLYSNAATSQLGAVQNSEDPLTDIAYKSGFINRSGFFLNSRTSTTATTLKLFRNGGIEANATTSGAGQTLNTSSLYLGAVRNMTISSPYASNYNDGQYAFTSIGDGLTDTEAANFYTAVQAYQTTLSRQV